MDLEPDGTVRYVDEHCPAVLTCEGTVSAWRQRRLYEAAGDLLRSHGGPVGPPPRGREHTTLAVGVGQGVTRRQIERTGSEFDTFGTQLEELEPRLPCRVRACDPRGEDGDPDPLGL